MATEHPVRSATAPMENPDFISRLLLKQLELVPPSEQEVPEDGKVKKRSSVFLIGAACAACCAPLLAPMFGVAGVASFGAAGAGWFTGLRVGEIVCIGVIAALAVFAGVWALQWRAASKKRLTEGASCEVGGGCDPRASAKPD